MYQVNIINIFNNLEILFFLLQLPLCFRKKSMLFCSTVDLSIFRALPGSMEPSSLISTLNWSRRFFSDLFLDTLKNKRENVLQQLWQVLKIRHILLPGSWWKQPLQNLCRENWHRNTYSKSQTPVFEERFLHSWRGAPELSE